MMSWDPLQITTFTADKWAKLKIGSIPFDLSANFPSFLPFLVVVNLDILPSEGPDEPLARPAFGSPLASFTKFSLRPSWPCLLLVWTEKIMAQVYPAMSINLVPRLYNDRLRPIADHHTYSWQMNYVEDGINTFLTRLQISFLQVLSHSFNSFLVW